MAQPVKALATEPDNLSPVPRICVVGRENRLRQVSSDLHTSATACTNTHTHRERGRETEIDRLTEKITILKLKS